MSRADAYVTLVSSLPRSERLFRAKLPPLSRERLDRRLRMLTEEDAACLARVESVLSWASHDIAETDAEAVAAAEAALTTIPQPTLRAIVGERMELRTIVAALRHRRERGAPPSGRWGVGGVVRRIEERWTEPTFGLGGKHPWLATAARLVAARDPAALERHILETTHRQLARHGAGHLFDFEAVAIYVLKWSIFDRWVRSDGAAARARFEALSAAAFRSFDDAQLREIG